MVLSITDCCRVSDDGEPSVALQSCMRALVADEDHIAVVVQKVLEARDRIAP